MSLVHPTAIVEDGARLGADVRVGPFSVIGRNVVLGDGVSVESHVSIVGRTTIGAGTKIFPFASLGSAPQSVHYKGEDSSLVIGRDCIIREGVTMSIGTAGGRMETTVGDRCFLMAGSHIAHDCVIGNNVIFANNATLAGHVTVGDFVFFGGLAAVHQFVRIGEQVIIGGLCPVHNDVIPFGAMRDGETGLHGLNLVGLKRRGFDRATIHSLRAAYRELFYGGGTLAERVDRVAESHSDDPNAMRIIAFIREGGKRRITTPRDAGGTGDDD